MEMKHIRALVLALALASSPLNADAVLHLRSVAEPAVVSFDIEKRAVSYEPQGELTERGTVLQSLENEVSCILELFE